MNRFNTTFNESSIETIIGTMFSGKSRELLFRGMRAENYGSIDVHYFKSAVDTRNDDLIKSRDGLERKGFLFKSGKELLDQMNDKPKGLILIDEGQFADRTLVSGHLLYPPSLWWTTAIMRQRRHIFD